MKITAAGCAKHAGLLLLSCCADILDLSNAEPAPTTCAADDQCPSAHVCFETHCLLSCRSNDDCIEEAACESGACVPTGDRCLPGRKRCDKLVPQVCLLDGTWAAVAERCPMACSEGSCWTPPSCNGDFGCSEASCCAADFIPGGQFELPYSVMGEERRLSAEVKPFALDRFEVTVGRFYRYLAAYDRAGIPVDGYGAQSNVPSSAWRDSWAKDPRLVNPSAESLEAGIASCDPAWADTNKYEHPMHCVNWYIAFSFCAWDGGRLPTEIEWSFAALGGDEARPYPWSTASFDSTVDSGLACYRADDQPCDGVQPVGSYPAGVGRWGTLDLAGNVQEWVVDGYRDEPGQAGCRDWDPRALETCVPNDTEALRVVRGGSYAQTAARILSGFRVGSFPERRNETIGFRCARDL